MKLYFIALIPHEEIQSQVYLLKQEMMTCFKAKHALKSPAHITLQMPFKRNTSLEEEIQSKLHSFASKQFPIEIQLSNFGAFTPRVIYINVADHEPIIILHSNLKKFLSSELKFDSDEISSRFHPHMTIATRDLTKKNFNAAWGEFEDRKYEGTFIANSLYLLKHNGKFWDIHREFPFGE